MLAFSVGLSLYLGWFVPVGVALYWTASNLFAVVQLYGLNFAINPRKYIDYEKLGDSRQKLEELEHLGRGGDRKAARALAVRERALEGTRLKSIPKKSMDMPLSPMPAFTASITPISSRSCSARGRMEARGL
mgnify:CR=1 FL=1